jgi:hypothetical protein
MKLTDIEQDVCEDTPDILDALAEWHEHKEDLAGTMGLYDSAKFHHCRAVELRCEAKRIRLSWED